MVITFHIISSSKNLLGSLIFEKFNLNLRAVYRNLIFLYSVISVNNDLLSANTKIVAIDLFVDNQSAAIFHDVLGRSARSWLSSFSSKTALTK